MNDNERSFAHVPEPASADALEAKLSECKKRIGELYSEIGKAYCLLAGDTPAPELEALVKEVRLNEKLAAEYAGELDAHTDTHLCPVCGKPVAEGSLFCTFCGASLNDVTPAEEKAPAGQSAPEAAPDTEHKGPEKICPHCGAHAVGDLPFCMVCGNRIDEAPAPAPEPEPAAPQGRICPVCGAPAAGDMPFCTSCGSRIDADPATSSAPAPEPEPAAPQGRVCPVCGAPAAEGVLFCTSCGSRLDADPMPAPAHKKRFCTVCGNEVPEGNLFCTACGTKV